MVVNMLGMRAANIFTALDCQAEKSRVRSPKKKIGQILGKIEFRCMPKHASWFNSFEIEIDLMILNALTD
jgi:hypothetical protein